MENTILNPSWWISQRYNWFWLPWLSIPRGCQEGKRHPTWLSIICTSIGLKVFFCFGVLIFTRGDRIFIASMCDDIILIPVITCNQKTKPQKLLSADLLLVELRVIKLQSQSCRSAPSSTLPSNTRPSGASFEYEMSDDEIEVLMKGFPLTLNEEWAFPFRSRFGRYILPEEKDTHLAAMRLLKLGTTILQSYSATDNPTKGTVIDQIARNTSYDKEI